LIKKGRTYVWPFLCLIIL